MTQAFKPPTSSAPDPITLARRIEMKGGQKYHQYLSDELLEEELARDWLSTEDLPEIVGLMIDSRHYELQ
tara:strand:+ start:331 stop:540 length:210 start_codon:yes stop_codon:yes gene_type:complete